MTQPPAPDTILELIVCNCKKGCNGNCKCARENLASTEACQCERGDDCENPNTFKSEETLYQTEAESSSESDNDGFDKMFLFQNKVQSK